MTAPRRSMAARSSRVCTIRFLARPCSQSRGATGSRCDAAEGRKAMTHATMRPEFEELIDPYAPVAQVGSGFTFTEGPIWHPVEHFLLFSDMPADVRRRWDP